MTDIERIEEIKKILEEPSLLALARRLGMPSAQVFYDIRAGKCGISKELILKIQRQIPQINQVWLLTGNGEILLSTGGNNAQVGDINNAPGGVQNVSNNCGHVVNETTLSPPEPSGQSFAEVLQQLVVTNAKLVETNAQLVAMLNISKNQ